MRSDRGQGTIEYLAVVLLVATIFAGGSAVAHAAGADIATAVPHEIRRALCIVTGGDCDRDRAPCDVESQTTSSSWTANIALLEIGHGRTVIRDRLSDGTELVTLVKAPRAGLEAMVGGRLRAGRGVVGWTATASIVAALGHGQTWVAPSAAAAAAIVDALDRGDLPRRADQDFRQVDVIPGIGASVDLGRVAEATTSIAPRLSVGTRLDRRTREHTYFLESGAGAVLDASAHLGRLDAGAGADAERVERFELTVDAGGRWKDLALIAGGDGGAGASLEGHAGAVGAALDVPAGGARRWAVEGHLDLSEPANLAAAHALVDDATALPPNPRGVARSAIVLARRFDEAAVIDVRAYSLHRRSHGIGAHVGIGAGVGADHESSTEQTRLISAATRGLDGQWRRREDCLKEARG